MTDQERIRAETIEECARMAEDAIANGVVVLSAAEVGAAIRSLVKLPVMHAYGGAQMAGTLTKCGVFAPAAHVIRDGFLAVTCDKCNASKEGKDGSSD